MPDSIVIVDITATQEVIVEVSLQGPPGKMSDDVVVALEWDSTTSTYGPAQALAMPNPKTYIGPTDPETVGITMGDRDYWIKTTA